MRARGHDLRRAFGQAAHDDSIAFGYPLNERDRRAVSLDLDALELDALGGLEDVFADSPDSPLPSDMIQKQLVQALKRDRGRAAELKRELDIVEEWKAIGPFFMRCADAGACMFEPEHHLDFSNSVTAVRALRDDVTGLDRRDPTPGRDPKERPDVLLLPTGWIHFDYKSFGQLNGAIYALK